MWWCGCIRRRWDGLSGSSGHRHRGLRTDVPPPTSQPMPYPIEEKLVVGISSTALFDLTKEHQIFLDEGLEAFRKYQADNAAVPPEPGAAYPFIKRLLHLNKVFPDQAPVEVVMMSRNDPEAGRR